MTLAVNEARGEVLLKIDEHELAIAATMEGLAALSSRLKCDSLADLWGKLTAMEVNAVLAGIDVLTVKGDKAKALGALRIKHFKDCQDAFVLALNHQMAGDEGNGGAAAEEKTKESRGGSGNSSPSVD